MQNSVINEAFCFELWHSWSFLMMWVHNVLYLQVALSLKKKHQKLQIHL